MESHTTQDAPIAAIVLAAGLSQRMGKFKPLLPFGNQTVIEYTINYLRAGGVHSIVVVAGHREDEIRNLLKNQEVIFVVNPRPESAMGDSIKLGVQTAPESTAAFLIAPVDHPAVPSDVVLKLIENWRAGNSLIIPTWNNRGGHPVLVDSSFRDALLALGAGGLRPFFNAHEREVLRLPVSTPYVVRDMDTWDDYVRLHESFFGFPPKEQASRL